MRGLAFLGIFFLFWITTAPFVDLRNPDVLLAAEDGSLLQQVCVGAAFLAAAAILVRHRDAAAAAVSPALLGVLAWQALTVLTSTHPDLSIRRFVLSILVMAIALAWLLIPRDQAQFGRLLAVGCAAVLGLAYVGLALFPEVAIHNLAEVLETENAGAWRGHFAHKNIAGAATVILIIYGAFIARRQSPFAGLPIVAAAAVFLWGSDNKTSIALVAAAFALAWLVERARPLWLKACVSVLPVGLMALFTVGSVMFEPVRALVAAVSADPTFTHRTDVWRFALDHLALHPVLGYGFQAFWRTSSLVNGGASMESWAANAGHAHDAYLNVAVTLGIPGMLLVIWWLVWEPLRDFHASQANGNDADVSRMFLRVWMFAMLYAGLESPFFADRGPIWFSILGAVFGLRLHARAKQVAASVAGDPRSGGSTTTKSHVAPNRESLVTAMNLNEGSTP